MAGTRDYFVIEGGHPLRGAVEASGNKNAALPALAASLLTDEPVILHNLPAIRDVETMAGLLARLGVEVERLGPHDWKLCAAEVKPPTEGGAAIDLFRSIRGSVLITGPLLGRHRRVSIPMPGGDRIGRRRVDTHFLAFRALGAEMEVNGHFYRVRADRLRGTSLLLDEASVTGTENAVMAAVLASGTTVIRNAASEPHVQDLCRMLNAMGAQIEGIGTNRLIIEGVERLHGVEFTIGADHIEVGSYIAMAAATGSEITIRNASPEHLEMVRLVYERLGVHFETQGADIVVPAEQPRRIIPDLGGAIPSISDAPWPAFPADLMSITLVMATQADGVVLFHDKMFESRLFFVDKLISMGARVVLCDPHRAIVYGPSPLHGYEMESPDIRAGMALLVAALAAQGTSIIRNVRQIDRGYEAIEKKLRPLGAQIERRSEM